jgi:hypothetical protein
LTGMVASLGTQGRNTSGLKTLLVPELGQNEMEDRVREPHRLRRSH